jgi:hypothetical protein
VSGDESRSGKLRREMMQKVEVENGLSSDRDSHHYEYVRK